MKRISKVVALCLLLSILVSVFAVFSFGADATMSPTTIYDMEKHVGDASGDFINGDPALIGDEPSFQILKKTSTNNVTYYQHLIKGELQPDGTYKNPNVSSSIYYQAGFNGRAIIADSQKYGDKNTDFMVIDFDFSTDGTFGDFYYFMNQWLKADGKESSGDRVGNHYPRIEGGTISESFNVYSYYTSNTSTVNYISELDNTGWVDVTIVYDFRGQNYENWRGYVYLNGIYAGEMNAELKGACSFYISRFVYDTTFTTPEATINFANYTIKSFPVDYNGELATEVDNLGQAYYDIGSFSDLGYCLKNKPVALVATVERGEETITVSNPLALDGSLIDGDKVTLYADVVKPVIVPKGANITWDTNGRYMVPVHEVDYEKVNVVLRDLKTGAILGYAKNPVFGINDAYDQNAIQVLPEFSSETDAGIKYTVKYDAYNRAFWTLNADDPTKVTTEHHYLHFDGSAESRLPIGAAATKYLMIDVDLKASSNTFELINLELELSDAEGNVLADGAASSPAYVYKDGKLGLANSKDKNTAYYSTTSTGKWTHLTVVYDFTADTAAGWVAHAYIDGVYAGVLSTSFADGAAFLNSIKVKPGVAAKGAALDFANWTVKYFDDTYNGTLGEQLAKTEIKLADISDLEYCMENLYSTKLLPEGDPIVGITTKFDQQSAALPTWRENKTSGVKHVSAKDEYGRVYWTVCADDATKIIGGSGAEWHSISGASNIQMANTNYIVIDVDIKPGEHTLTKFYYNMRFNADGGEDFYYVIEDGKIGFANDAAKQTKYMADYSGGWAHLTLVYDVTSSSYSDWKAYGYVNGNFVGQIAGTFNQTVTSLDSIRFQVSAKGTEADANTTFANWTLKTFDNTYNGNLGDMLANNEYTLADIDDLAYCMENALDEKPVEDNAPIVGITSPYDQNSMSTPISISSGTGATAKSYYRQETDAYGRTYWTMYSEDATAVSANWHYVGYKEGATRRALDDTQYLVIDVDIKAGENPFTSMSYNINYYKYDAAGAPTRVSGGGTDSCPAYVYKDGKYGIACSSDTNVAFYPTETEGEWTHLTVVYDYRGTYQDWKAHAYIDGEYMGVISKSFSKAKTAVGLNYIRLQSAVASAADATTSFANMTVKHFDGSYNGKIGDMLANNEYTLSDIDDLAYCMENDPDKAALLGVNDAYSQAALDQVIEFEKIDTVLVGYTKQLDSYGREYWTLGAADATGITNEHHYLGLDGTSPVVLSKTEYMVIDVDLKAGSNSFNGLGLVIEYLDTDGNAVSATIPDIAYGYVNGKLGIISGSTGYFADANDGEWTHLTVVYDFTGDTYEDWIAYAYVDGVYMGVLIDDFGANIAAINSLTVVLDTPDFSDATFGIANWTVKYFDDTYNGTMADRLADEKYTLDDVSDLEYCMDNDLDGPLVERYTVTVGISTPYNNETLGDGVVNKFSNVNNKKNDPDYNSGLKYESKTDDYERTYWTLVSNDSTNITNGEWHYLTSSAFALADTDYLVFDVDIKPGENSFSSFYHNISFANANGNSIGNPNADFYYIVEDGKVGVRNAGGDKKFLSESAAGGWTQLTVVYDFTASSYKNWKAYAYIDGKFAGDLGVKFDATGILSWVRFQPQSAQAADATTSFANWTIKRFADGYNGSIPRDIAKDNVGLEKIVDLAYCVDEDMNNEPVEKEPIVIKTEYGTQTLKDALAEYSKSLDMRATFLQDTIYHNTSVISYTRKLVMDLNGNTLTLQSEKTGSSAPHSFAVSGSVTFNNGKIIDNNEGNANVIYIDAANSSAKVMFQNIDDITVNSTHPMIEQRAGSVSFINCANIDAKNAMLDSMRGGNYLDVSLYFKNSTITATSNAVYVTNTRASSMRYGSFNNTVAFNNCDVTASESIVRVDGYASEQGKVTGGAFAPTAGHADNNNVATMVIIDSNLKAGDAVIYSQISDIRNVAHDVDGDGKKDAIYADNFKLVTNTKIIGSTIKADYLARQDITANGTLPTTFSLRSAGYLHTTNVTLDTATVELDVAHATKSAPATADAININYTGECALNTTVLSDVDGIEGANIEMAGGYYLVPRSADGVLPYALTTNVAPYPYIIDGEEYEFYWYAGDVVTTDRIPVDITSNSPYVGFEWADEVDENGAYFLETTVTVPIKANMSLSNNFAFNIYLPVDLGDNSFTTFRVNGEKVQMADVTIDGVKYKALSIKDISPINAAEAFELSFTVYTEDGLSASATKMISILDYAESVLKNTNETTEARELIAALVNYIAKMYAAAGRQDAALAALLELDEYKAITLDGVLPVAKSTIDELGVFETVGLTAGDNFSFAFRTNAGFNGNLVFTYYKNGTRFMETIMVRDAEGDGEVITLDMKAYDILSDITIRCNGVSGEYNLSAYISELKAAEADSDIIELAEALSAYSYYAAAYLVSQPNP